ncbi:MAG: hypothetical protein ACM3XM_14610 [Mycobacterium leprae]
MFGLSSDVRLTDVGSRDGMVRGEFGGYRWEARLTRGPVSYGLDPASLYKGYGQVARLVLHQRIGGSQSYRKVAAFDHGWLFGRKEHLAAIRRVVHYLVG